MPLLQGDILITQGVGTNRTMAVKIANFVGKGYAHAAIVVTEDDPGQHFIVHAVGPGIRVHQLNQRVMPAIWEWATVYRLFQEDGDQFDDLRFRAAQVALTWAGRSFDTGRAVDYSGLRAIGSLARPSFGPNARQRARAYWQHAKTPKGPESFQGGVYCSHLAVAVWQAVLGPNASAEHIPLDALHTSPRDLAIFLNTHDKLVGVIHVEGNRLIFQDAE